MNVTPDQHETTKGGAAAAVEKKASQQEQIATEPTTVSSSSLSKGRLAIREDDSDLLKLAAPRLSSSVVEFRSYRAY